MLPWSRLPCACILIWNQQETNSLQQHTSVRVWSQENDSFQAAVGRNPLICWEVWLASNQTIYSVTGNIKPVNQMSTRLHVTVEPGLMNLMLWICFDILINWDLSVYFVLSVKFHLEDVGGVGQRRGQDSGHDTTEDVDDHRLVCQERPEISLIYKQKQKHTNIIG